MIYPNVALKIENSLPSIELHSAEGQSRTLATSPKSLEKLLTDVAAILGAKWDYAEIMNRLREADEYFVIFPDVEFETDELNFDSIEEVVQQAVNGYADVEGMTEELADEVNANWYADVLASTLHQAYNILIVRTVFFASELGIGDIQLIDSQHDARLREKMSRDLDDIGLELLVPEPLTLV